MSVAPLPAGSDARLHGANLRRVMAERNLTLGDVARAAGVAIPTVRGIVEETQRPHPRTLHKLSAGLGVSVDELFAPITPRDPDPVAAALRFDRRTNPAVAEAISSHPDVFRDWAAADFDDLYSRVAVGGELTEEGALAAAAAINERRALLAEVALLLETDQADRLRECVADLRREAQIDGGQSPSK